VFCFLYTIYSLSRYRYIIKRFYENFSKKFPARITSQLSANEPRISRISQRLAKGRGYLLANGMVHIDEKKPAPSKGKRVEIDM
jgi:hypothetical protein